MKTILSLQGFILGTVCVLSSGLLPAQAAVEITYVYDDLNLLTTVSRSDAPVVTYGYQANGNVTTQAVTNSPDTDGDQIANFADPDDDNDGMPDAFEEEYRLKPLDASDADDDPDEDGLSNLQEFLDGTSPLVSNTPAQIPLLPWGGSALLMVMLGGVLMRRMSKHGG